MKKLAIFLFSLALLFEAGMANAGYTEKLTVQVFDQQLRMVEGAEAYVSHQLNSVAGYTRTKPKLTNSSGLADLVFTSYEEIETQTEYSYTLYVKYGNQTKVSNHVAEKEPPENPRVVSAEVQSRYVFARVLDQKGRPLGADITILEKTKKTDSAGSAAFQLPPGIYTVRAEREGSVQSRQVNLEKSDAAVEFSMGLYPLLVKVSDDRKTPLVASVEINGAEKSTDANGTAQFENITDSQPQVLVMFGNLTKRTVVDLEKQGSLEVVFDTHPPAIKEMNAVVSKSGAGAISLFVEDAGALASGIDSVAVSYEVGGVERNTPAYTIGYNAFEAKIPAQPKGSAVRYFVKVTDKEGNAATRGGTYVVEADAPKKNSTTPIVPPKQQDLIDFGRIDAFTGAIYMLVLLVVVYGVFYYLNKKKEQTFSPPAQPPVSPPAIPPA